MSVSGPPEANDRGGAVQRRHVIRCLLLIADQQLPKAVEPRVAPLYDPAPRPLTAPLGLRLVANLTDVRGVAPLTHGAGGRVALRPAPARRRSAAAARLAGCAQAPGAQPLPSARRILPRIGLEAYRQQRPPLKPVNLYLRISSKPPAKRRAVQRGERSLLACKVRARPRLAPPWNGHGAVETQRFNEERRKSGTAGWAFRLS